MPSVTVWPQITGRNLTLTRVAKLATPTPFPNIVQWKIWTRPPLESGAVLLQAECPCQMESDSIHRRTDHVMVSSIAIPGTAAGAFSNAA